MFKLDTLTSKTALAVLLWFLWNLAKTHVGAYLPPEAVTLLDTGLVAAGVLALRDTMTKLQQSATATQVATGITAAKVEQVSNQVENVKTEVKNL